MPAPSSLRGSALSTNEVSPPEEYFRGVSTLCRRMLDDMSAVKESFGEDWDQLTYHQQCRVIDQAIVDEATVRRYDNNGAAGPECEYFPKLKLPTGQKVVCDETLTARGFSCSWRDEHSAPFSWHTRSQMDLTLDTPPDTPTHPSTPVEGPSTTIEGEGRVIPGGRAVYSARPISLPRPPRFRWHYDPPDGPPDPPSIVVAAPKSATLPTDLGRAPPKSPPATKYMLVRGKGEENEGGGILAKIRGAVAALTATCLPLRATLGPTSHLSVHSASAGGGEPELRPLHVQTQSSKYSPDQTTDKHSSRSSLGSNKGCQAPLSNITSDPSLSGYVCSLPDDDDDVPYTIINTSNSTQEQLPTAYHTSTAIVAQATETPTYTSSNTSSVGLGSTMYMSAAASLPTPVPTPGDSTNPIENFSPMCSSTPAPPYAELSKPLRPMVLQQPDLITDTLEARAADKDTKLTRKSMFEERKPESFDNDNELFTPVLSRKSEVIIPKTGFDFLDNW